MFERVAIVGVGLIGGSVALALDRAGAARRIVGVDASRSALERALQLGVIDEAARDVGEAVRGSDVTVVAVPVGRTAAALTAIRPHLGLRGIVTDVGSVKASVIAQAREVLGGAFPQFVPAHPIAGKERSGVDAAEATLFDGQRCVLTPSIDTAGHALDAVREMWSACGALVADMTPERHDAVYAAVSHLPHLLAYAYVAAMANAPDAATRIASAGSGFRDFTRIAAASPEMWRDICIANRGALLAELASTERELARLRAALEAGDGATVAEVFSAARAWRTGLRG